MPEILWYYAKNDQQLGPVAPSELKKLAESGSLAPGDLIWREGMDGWAPASKVKGLFPADEPRAMATAPPVASNGPTETMPPEELAAILATPATPAPAGIPADVFLTPTPAADISPPTPAEARAVPAASRATADAQPPTETTFDLLWLGQLVLWGICIATVFLGGILFAAELVRAKAPAEETAAAMTFATFIAAAYVIARAGERVAYLVQIYFERRRH